MASKKLVRVLIGSVKLKKRKTIRNFNNFKRVENGFSESDRSD